MIFTFKGINYHPGVKAIDICQGNVGKYE